MRREHIADESMVKVRAGIRSLWRLLSKAFGRAPADVIYKAWLEKYDTIAKEDEAAIRAHIQQLSYRPRISILLPVYNTPKPLLRNAIDSVRAQLYGDWELCIANDASTMRHVNGMLASYRRKDARIKVFHRLQNGHISAASNSALEMATGEFVALLDHDDELRPHALYMVAATLNKHPDADLLYSDEDKIDIHGRRYEPFFKPDWNPDLLYSQNFVCHLAVFRTDVVRKVGGFRVGYEGSQDYDLILRMSEHVSSGRIHHIPFILYHWRAIPGSIALDTNEKPYATDASSKSIQDHFDRVGIAAQCKPAGLAVGHFRAVYQLPVPLPLVSIIIPVKGEEEGVSEEIGQVLDERTSYQPFEIVLVCDSETNHKINASRPQVSLKVVCTPAGRNIGGQANFGAACARGDILVFLAPHLEPFDAEWLRELVSHALRPEIGAVGAKLYDCEGRVRHAGFILGVGGSRTMPTHHRLLRHHATGYFNLACLIQNMSAISIDGMAMRRQIFDEIGGFDTELPLGTYADVDLCLRLRDHGYRILWTPYAELVHRLPYNQAPARAPTNTRVLKTADEYMRARWGARWSANDPYYNGNLDPEVEGFAPASPPRIVRPWTSH